MTVNGRNKGANFERMIARELHALTGIGFRRHLDQYRERDNSDLIPSDPAFPFALELKHYGTGTGLRDTWKAQAERAAERQGRWPCVIYRINRGPIRCAIPMRAMCPQWPSDVWAELTLSGLATIAAERMAEAAI